MKCCSIGIDANKLWVTVILLSSPGKKDDSNSVHFNYVTVTDPTMCTEYFYLATQIVLEAFKEGWIVPMLARMQGRQHIQDKFVFFFRQKLRILRLYFSPAPERSILPHWTPYPHISIEDSTRTSRVIEQCW